MLLTVTTTAPDATHLGYLLHKHPDKVQHFELAFGTATVCYPQADPDECTAALLVDVDPIALVRGRKDGGDDFALQQYVNDRPYAASSMLSVAIAQVFGTALAGRCQARPELASTELPLRLHLPALPARGRAGALRGADLVRALFEPLGWQVQTTQVPLADGLDWGAAPYLDTVLTGRQRLADALSHVYVLLPVLDDAKHYWVGQDEVDKLLRHGQRWLAGHPLRDVITRRYLGWSRYVRDATARLAALDDSPETETEPVELAEAGRREAGPADSDRPASPGEATARGTLRDQRRDTVLQVLRESGARRVADVGCGEGYYLQGLLADPTFTQILGVDVSATVLARAERRLGLDRLPQHQQDRISLRQSSLTYRDDALAGYDALLLVEVVEHVDPDRLPALASNVFGFAGPGTVVVTTPNVEYNVRYGLTDGHLRHPDHRFEWTRAQFQAWAADVCAQYGYSVSIRPVGEPDPEAGAPTQLALFTREVAA